MMVEAQRGLARLLSPSRVPSLPAYGKPGLAQGRCQELWLNMQPPAQVPCSSVSSTHLDLPAFGAAPYSLGPTSWNSQSKDSEQQPECPARKPRVLPASEQWLSRWHSAFTGNQHLPKGEPCPCSSSNSPTGSAAGAGQGGEPCSPSQGFSS